MSFPDPHLSCPLCSDEGLPARVVALDAASNMATVQLEDGGEREVALDLLDDVAVGEIVVVHLDVAIGRMSSEG